MCPSSTLYLILHLEDHLSITYIRKLLHLLFLQTFPDPRLVHIAVLDASNKRWWLSHTNWNLLHSLLAVDPDLSTYTSPGYTWSTENVE
jgi:hypothetical protein